MKKVKYNDTYIYVDDSPVDVRETGVVIKNNSNLENTIEIPNNNSSDLLEDTLTNVWSNDYDKKE